MKYRLISLMAAMITFACGPTDRDSVKQAHYVNINSAVKEDVSEFLTEAADARMMDIEQGQLAATRGTTSDVREYGEWMVKDQTRMLRELRILAASKNIMLPNILSHKRAKALQELKQKKGKEFDRKFIEMMRKDHKRGVDDFKDATGFRDKDIREYADNYLPVVQAHLDKIPTLDDSKNVAEARHDLE